MIPSMAQVEGETLPSGGWRPLLWRGMAELWVTSLAWLAVFAFSASGAEGVALPEVVPPSPPTAIAVVPPPSEAFDAAARLYEQGRALEAAEAYERLESRGILTASVCFNQGNAWLQAGRLGRAIASYRLAQSLEPRDPEIAANLELARSRVAPGAVRGVGGGGRFLKWFRPDEWAMLALGVMWAWMAWLVWQQRATGRSSSNPGAGRLPMLCLGLLTIVLGGVAWWAADLATRPTAVVIAGDTAARFGPLQESQTAFTLPDGAELRVTDSKGSWREVRDATGRRGWVLERNLALVP